MDKDDVSHRGAAARALLARWRDREEGLVSRVDLDAFADLVRKALESLPEEFRDRLENIQVDIEEWPTRAKSCSRLGLRARDKHALLGLYHGVPLTERHEYYMACSPIASPSIRSPSRLHVPGG